MKKFYLFICLLLLMKWSLPHLSQLWPEHLKALSETLDVFEATGLWSLFLFVLSFSLSLALGRLGFRLLGFGSFKDPLEERLFAAAAGLAILGELTFLLGAAQLYYSTIFQILFLVGVLLTPLSWKTNFSPIEPEMRSFAGKILQDPLLGAGMLLVLSFLGVYLLAALAPETGFDALNYHLGIPRLFLVEHGIHHTPHIVYSNFPFQTEMLFTLGWLIDSMSLAKLFHYGFGLLTAASIVVFSRRFLTPECGLWASLLFLSSPIVGFLMQTAYVDLALTFYFFLAFYAFVLWQDSGRRDWLILSALLAGVATATKYTGIMAVVFGLLYIAALGLWQRRPVLKNLLLFGLVAAIAPSLWMVKNLIWVGNPVAPLFSDVFLNPDFKATDYGKWLATTNNWAGLPGGILDYLRSPWLLTFQSLPAAGTAGPLFLLLLPLALVVGWRRFWVRHLAIFCLFLFASQILSSKLVRYHVTLLPFLGILIAASFWSRHQAEKSIRQRLIAGSLSLAVLLGSFLQLPFFWNFWQEFRISTVNPASIRLFTSERARRQYMAEQLSGSDLLEVHDFLNLQSERPGQILTLTVAYQALLDRPLLMTPNSSSAVEVTDFILDRALAASGLSTIRMAPLQPSSYRHWRLELPDASLEPEFYLPRFFFLQDEIELELPVPVVTRTEEDQQVTVTADLGDQRKVEVVQFWGGSDEQHIGVDSRLKLFASPDGKEWTRINLSIEIRRPPKSPLTMIEALRRYQVDYLVYEVRPEVFFLDTFFAQQAGDDFCLVHRAGRYRVYQVSG